VMQQVGCWKLHTSAEIMWWWSRVFDWVAWSRLSRVGHGAEKIGHHNECFRQTLHSSTLYPAKICSHGMTMSHRYHEEWGWGAVSKVKKVYKSRNVLTIDFPIWRSTTQTHLTLNSHTQVQARTWDRSHQTRPDK
jgi:hypothetical protein